MAVIPSQEELEQMSIEDLEALSGQIAQEGVGALGAPSVPDAIEEPLPGVPVGEPPAEGEEELAVAEVEDTGAPLEAAEPVLAQILTATQDPKEILDMLRSQGFEVRRSPGAAEAEVTEQEAEIEEAPEVEEAASAAVSEPVNMSALRKKAAANALQGA